MSRPVAPPAKLLHDLCTTGAAAGLADGPLLDRFAETGDEAAFEALVRRHGAMVLRVCRASLRDEHAARDAFQATFLVLVRRAGSIRRRESIAPWLRGVAARVASGLRRAEARHRAIERAVLPTEEPRSEAAPADDTASTVREEVARLPGPFRSAIELCHLDGLTHEEAAARLGLPVGTVRSRLARGRDRLRTRLIRRGLAPALAASLAESARAFPPAIPDPLVSSTLRLGLGFAAGDRAVAGASASLARRTLRSLSMNRLLKTFAGTIAIAALAGSGAIASRFREGPPPALSAPAEDPPTEGEVRVALRFWWEGIESLEFREEWFVLGPGGRPDRLKARMIYEHAWGPGHRRAMVSRNIAPDGFIMSENALLEDGATSVDLSWRPDPLREELALQWAESRNQTNTRDHYDGGMTNALWALTCSLDGVAEPLHAFLDGRGELSIEPGDGGHPRAVLTVGRRFGPVHYELDPGHGWLPRRLWDDHGAFDTTVTRFEQVGGRWFPAELLTKANPDDPAPNRLVRIDGIRINRPIPDETFRPPAGVDTKRASFEVPGAFGPEDLVNARERPEDPEHVDELVAILRSIDSGSGIRRDAIEILRAHHLADPRLGELFQLGDIHAVEVYQLVALWGNPPYREFLASILAETPHREVRAHAMLALASCLARQAEVGLRNHRTIEQAERSGDDGPRPFLAPVATDAEAASLAEEASRLLDDLIDNHADLEAIASLAREERGDLQEFRQLLRAPDPGAGRP